MPGDNQFMWDQFARLGEMMGDGLHHEPDGKWISKEYKRLSKILVPEIKVAARGHRQMANKIRDEKIKTFLLDRKCRCGGILAQVRSGSLKVKCQYCKNCYVVKRKKK